MTICVACDGSKKGNKMGGGIAILPPYGQVPQDVVVCGYPFRGTPATNVRAELLAATKASATHRPSVCCPCVSAGRTHDALA